MTLIERMVAAGMSRDCATETAMWYMAQGDDEGLEDYVTALEAGRRFLITHTRLMGPTILLPRLLRLHKYISPSNLLSNPHRPFSHRVM